MAQLSRIADVTINLGTLAIAEKSFDEIMVLSANTNLTDRITAISSTADLLAISGMADTDPLYAVASAVFGQGSHVRTLYIGHQVTTPTAESVADALTACAAAAPTYLYGLLLESRLEADVTDAATWAEANERLFGTSTNDATTITATTTDIGATLKASNLMRTFVCYTSHSDTEYPEAALMSNRFTFYAGQTSWSNVRLSGVTADKLTEAEYLYAAGKDVSTFETFRNFALTQGGKVAGDEWIDVIRLRDQLVEAIKVSVVGAIVRATNSTGKLPFTDGGIQVIGAAIRQPLDLNVARGGLAPPVLDDNGDTIPSYTITLPLAADISDNDKANRVLNDVYFTARIAGAIHTTVIKGALVYSFN